MTIKTYLSIIYKKNTILQSQKIERFSLYSRNFFVKLPSMEKTVVKINLALNIYEIPRCRTTDISYAMLQKF